MDAPMEVSLPQTMLQKLLDLLILESLKFCLKIHVHVIRHIRCQVNIDYHNQHESAALIGLFHATSLVLPSVPFYPIITDAERSTGVPLLSAAESTNLPTLICFSAGSLQVLDLRTHASNEQVIKTS